MPDSLMIRKPPPMLNDAPPPPRPLMFYLGVIRQHLPVIGGITLVCTILVVILCSFKAPVSVGSATIAIDRQVAPESVGANRVLSTGDDQFMATQQNLLLADTILRPVVERYNLLEREHQLRRYHFWHYSKQAEDLVRNAPIKLLRLKIERTPNTYLLTISYRDRNPRIAAEVANAIADSYLRNIFDTRIKEAGRLTSSMERQLIDLKQKMESTHIALMTYQRQLGTADPEQKTSVLVARLQALNTENSAAQADRIAKEAIFREAKDRSLPEVQVSSQSLDLSHDVANLRAAKANLAAVAATFGDQHPEYRKALAQQAEAQAALDESRENVASRIGVDYRQTLAREHMLSAAVADTKHQVDDLTSQSFDYLQLKHEADTAERVYEDLFAKIKQSGINSELQNNIIRLADSARPPAKPIFPNWGMIVSLSLTFFLLGGCAYFISRELTDVSAREGEAVQDALGIPVICALPHVANVEFRLGCGTDGAATPRRHPPSLQDGFFDEGIRHLRSYLMLSFQSNMPRSVLITSALPGEGKSTLALALALVSAEHGKRTLLIDGDLRQPAIERMAHLEPGAGLSEFLTGQSEWRAATRITPNQPNLSVLGPGRPVLNALTRIGPRMRGILADATQDYDLVILDSPPLLGCAETLELAAAAEITLIAVRAGHTTMKTLGSTVETLRRVNVPIAGIVLNGSSLAADPTFKAYARYYTTLGSA
jgi:polysaccharide biosynthesis transport protein